MSSHYNTNIDKEKRNVSLQLYKQNEIKEKKNNIAILRLVNYMYIFQLPPVLTK